MAVATEEDKHFSDSMLQWLAEGDRLHEDPKHHEVFLGESTTRRSWKLWAIAASAAALVVGGRFAVQHLGTSRAEANEAPVMTAVTPAPLTSAPQPLAVVAALVATATTKSIIEPTATAPAAVEAERAPLAHQGEPKPIAAAVPAVKEAGPIVAAQNPAPPAAAAPAPVASAALAAAPIDAPAAAPAVEDFATLLGRCRDATTRGRWGAARTACTAAQQAQPDSPDVLTRLAEIALNRGQGRAALRLASAALAADPAFADAYVIVGSIQQGENRAAEARAAYSQYLKLAPSGRYASDLRAILTTR